MSYNRAIYDPCAYGKRLDESTSVLSWNLDPNKFYNCNDCRIEFGVVGGNNVSRTKGNLVDLESELRNQTRLYSHCPGRKYIPNCAPNLISKDGLPCGSVAGRKEDLCHLRSCNMIDYKPRQDNIGYELNYNRNLAKEGCPAIVKKAGKRSKKPKTVVKKTGNFYATNW